MTGTPAQVEWAERIRSAVQLEFDRVARALSSVPGAQAEAVTTTTQELLEILEEKRTAVMSRVDAGYFIRDWQEISVQVRKMIADDPRYLAIRARRELLKKAAKTQSDALID